MELTPLPAEIERRPGALELTPGSLISGPGPFVDELLRRVEAEHGIPLDTARDAETAKVVLEVGPADESLGPEGYEIIVDRQAARVRADAPAGLFYGVQTFSQLVTADGRVPAVRITDRPRYPWRGVHLDVCRHFFPVEYVKRFIDIAARHKLNTFHWHLTEDQGWRIEIPRYPLLTETSAWRSQDGNRYGGFYTQDEIRGVVEYAARRYVTVVPEIEMPGHSVAALAAYPELSCTGGPFEVETQWGIFDDVYCAGSDATFEFLETVLDDVLGLFPSRFIHIGGDECPKTRWKSCPRCQERMEREKIPDLDALQSWFVSRAARFLETRGRRLLGWDEILEGGLAAGAAVMCWRDESYAASAVRQGADVVMCPTAHCYLDYKQKDSPDEPGAIGVTSLEQAYAFEPTPTGLDGTETGQIIGAQANVWTERMVDTERVEFMTFPRLCAIAEAAWTPASRRDWEGFRRRLPGHLERLDRWGVGYRPL